jgi:2EXR family/Chromo (CHRromatin Organisation MOdifier) domain
MAQLQTHLRQMSAQFSTLPWELRTQIYDLTLDRTPRIVEVEVRDGQVVSKTPPQPLLHLNRESRDFVLSVYKPWLPQFAGTTVHAPYADLLAKYGPSKTHCVSCLDEVCFDMERDTLFCRSQFLSPYKPSGWPVFLFGRIEESCLRNMAVNITGYLRFPRVVEALRNAKNLKTLYFSDDNPVAVTFKSEKISDGLRRREKQDRAKPKVRVPNYVAPQFVAAPASWFLPKLRQIPSKRLSWNRTKASDSYSESECEFEWLRPAPIWTTYKCPQRSSRVPKPPSNYVQIKQESTPRKRKADMAFNNDEVITTEQAKRIKTWIRAQKRNERKACSTPAPQAQPLGSEKTHILIRADDLAQMSEETKRQLGFVRQAASSTLGASSSSPSASEASSSDVPSEPSSSRPASDAGSMRDEDDSSEASESESEDDAQDEETGSEERTPRQLHAHRFNFDIGAHEILVEWEDSPKVANWEWVPKANLIISIPTMIAEFVANNPALETGTPVRFHERNSGIVGFDFLVEFEGHPEEVYWTWVPEFNMQTRVPHMVDQWMTENASEVNGDENVVEQILAERNYAENILVEDNDEIKGKEEAPDTVDADMRDEEGGAGDDDKNENDKNDEDEEPAEYVPKRFVAQRETPDGREILVEWEDWPDEKDWTWEPATNLQEDAPEMMKAWKSSRKAKKVSKVFEVESILGKRKIKGEWHYLVKWKGFPKEEAESLEPCDKLSVDVPELVEAFEKRRPKRGRPKKAART